MASPSNVVPSARTRWASLMSLVTTTLSSSSHSRRLHWTLSKTRDDIGARSFLARSSRCLEVDDHGFAAEDGVTGAAGERPARVRRVAAAGRQLLGLDRPLVLEIEH